MSENICWLKHEDTAELLDFLNLVFSMAGRPHDFTKMLPKMWENDGRSTEKHIAVKRDGRIRAVVGVYPYDLHVGTEVLKFATMGNVATHPYDEGKGYMTQLLEAAVQKLAELDVDCARLGGKRQRYARYGYEPCGSQTVFTLTANNILRFYKGCFKTGITFRRIKQEDIPDLEWCRTLFERGAVWVDRLSGTTFYNCVTAWKNTPWVAEEDGRPVGYLTASADKKSVSELNAVSEAKAVEVFCAWLATWDAGSVTLPVDPWEKERTRLLMPLAEYWHISIPSNFYIRNWDRMTGAYLKLKSKLTDLPEGKSTVGINGWGTMKISVENGCVSVCRTDETADLTLGHLEASRFLFGPLPPYTVSELPPAKAGLLNAWLPLPLGWNTLDRV